MHIYHIFRYELVIPKGTEGLKYSKTHMWILHLIQNSEIQVCLQSWLEKMIHLEKMVQLSGWQLQDDVETETTWGPQRVNSKSGNQEMCVSQLYKQCWYRNFQKTINWKCCPLVTLERRELIITEPVAPLEMPHLCIHPCELAFSFFLLFF